jgi:hypothetical protein
MAKLKRSRKASSGFLVGTKGRKRLRSFRPVGKRVYKKASGGNRARGYRVVGITTDGVRILRPKVKPEHFTSSEIRRAIAEVEGSASTKS